ncbi:MAG TPA: TetR/AcrR family transcriptional regulator [Euzebyales bacterium]|nr:TetR/AcrR family transcriptional regulator [Euzebyales bacterium]
MTARPSQNDRRRQQILRAAAKVINERGICDARIADIAAVAETSTGLILYYFHSKDALLAEALTFAEDQFYLHIFHGITEIEDPRAQLAHLIASSCPGAPEAAGDLAAEWTLWIELWARALHDDEVARKRAALDRRWRSTIADVVRAGQRQGVFADVDPFDFALELAALMDGLALQVVLDDTEVDSELMRRLSLGLAIRRLQFQLDDVTLSTAGG